MFTTFVWSLIAISSNINCFTFPFYTELFLLSNTTIYSRILDKCALCNIQTIIPLRKLLLLLQHSIKFVYSTCIQIIYYSYGFYFEKFQYLYVSTSARGFKLVKFLNNNLFFTFLPVFRKYNSLDASSKKRHFICMTLFDTLLAHRNAFDNHEIVLQLLFSFTRAYPMALDFPLCVELLCYSLSFMYVYHLIAVVNELIYIMPPSKAEQSVAVNAKFSTFNWTHEIKHILWE